MEFEAYTYKHEGRWMKELGLVYMYAGQTWSITDGKNYIVDVGGLQGR